MALMRFTVTRPVLATPPMEQAHFTEIQPAAETQQLGTRLYIAIRPQATIPPPAFKPSSRDTTGGINVANGVQALFKNITGGSNTGIGYQALFNNTTGNYNHAIGRVSLLNNSTGFGNIAVGDESLFSSTGNQNTAVGDLSGISATTGSTNVDIGAGMTGVAGESNACYIASIFNQTSASGVPVLINSSNKLGTTTSSKRFKEQIKPMNKASEALYSLKPVSFRYKKELDPAGTPQLGLVAEDVARLTRL